jgi:hypothetical protein
MDTNEFQSQPQSSTILIIGRFCQIKCQTNLSKTYEWWIDTRDFGNIQMECHNIWAFFTNIPMNMWELDIGNARINQHLYKPFHGVHEEIQCWKTFCQELVNPTSKMLWALFPSKTWPCWTFCISIPNVLRTHY